VTRSGRFYPGFKEARHASEDIFEGIASRAGRERAPHTLMRHGHGVMWFNKDGHFDKSAKREIRRCPMQSQKRRQYTEECRHEAVRLITEHGYGVTEAARNLVPCQL
jgi:hypothetical protein